MQSRKLLFTGIEWIPFIRTRKGVMQGDFPLNYMGFPMQIPTPVNDRFENRKPTKSMKKASDWPFKPLGGLIREARNTEGLVPGLFSFPRAI